MRFQIKCPHSKAITYIFKKTTTKTILKQKKKNSLELYNKK